MHLFVAVFDYSGNKGIDIIAVVKMTLDRHNAEVGYGAKLPSVWSKYELTE